MGKHHTCSKERLWGVKKLTEMAICIVVLLGLVVAASHGQEVIKVRLPVTKLAPVQTTHLRGSSSSFAFKIPIPSRWQIEKATLSFSYVNSTVLLSRNSRLVVRLDGRALGQVVLQPQSPVGTVTLSLPPRLLTPGYHDLEFSVSQHHTLDCEDPGSPELWTTLELDQSTIEFDVRLRRVPLQLSALANFLFDPRLMWENRVHLVIEDMSPERLEWAATVASGIAVRFDYRPVLFSLSHTIQPAMDNVLIGDPKFIRQVLGERTPQIQGATLKIMALPLEGGPPKRGIEDPGRGLIIVSGENEEQIRKSVRTLASLTFPYPGTQGMEVKEVRLPEVTPLQGKQFIRPNEKYSFRALGLETVTFKGVRPAAETLRFRIPSPFLPNGNEYAVLFLHVAYGGGMRKDSVLDILLNDKYVSSIHLENPQGGSFEGYRIYIPSYLLKRGTNALTFVPVLTPLVSGRCEFIQTDHLFLTLFGDSALKIPPMSHWVDLPRMELFVQDGFPFTDWPDGRETVVYLSDKSLDSAASAINLVSLAAQKIGYPAQGVRFRFEAEKSVSEDMIAVGPITSMPDSLLRAAPLQLTKQGTVHYPQLKKIGGQKDLGSSWVHRLLAIFFAPPAPEEAEGALMSTSSQQVSGLGSGRAVLTEFESPYRGGRSILMLTAQSSQEVLQGSHVLWEPSVQASLGGDLALVDLSSPDSKVSALQIGRKYYVGGRGVFSPINAFLYNHPWVFVAILVLAFSVLTYGIYLSLKKIRRHRTT
jgi:hypothetical protein